MRIDDMTYDTFVTELLYSISPLVPGNQSLVDFSAGEDKVRDSATLYCERAEFFSKLGQNCAEELGVATTLYLCGRTRISEEPIIRHSAYAKNIYRWMRGDKPRKRAARADLIILSTCWLFGWGDMSRLGDAAHDEARMRLHERLMIDVFLDTEPEDAIDALSKISATCYNNTIHGRGTL